MSLADLVDVQLHGMNAFSNLQVPNADVEKLKNEKIFERAVVIDTICDPSLRKEAPPTLEETEINSFFRAPRNSLICRIRTKDKKLDETSDIVCYPFFSSHFCLPVKPGEEVWVMKENLFDSLEDNRNYWISRVSEQIAIEDVNYSFFTRNITANHTGSLPPDRVLQFPNITEKGNLTIAGDNEALIDLIKGSLESNSIINEPVPRFTKRPGDLVLQGSNNATIVLGIDRGYDFQNRPDASISGNSNASLENTQKKSGTVDIVAGRGRYFDSDDIQIKIPRKKNQAGGIKNSTQTFIAKNSLESFESDKDPSMTQDLDSDKFPDPGNFFTNPSEGDPDFLVDASRIYVTENSEIDKRLGLEQLTASKFENDLQNQVGPSIAVKSDHIRIVARQVPNPAVSGKLPPNFENVGSNGTIRIVKEGGRNTDLATIIVESDGTIQISGSKIFIGRSDADGGNGGGPGPGGSQPYVKYSDLEKLWKDTMNALNSFCTTLSTHTTPGNNLPSPQINTAAETLKAQIGKLSSQIESVKSERIFGE